MSRQPKRHLFFVHQIYTLSILRPLQAEIRARGEEAAWFFEGDGAHYLHADEKQLTSIAEIKAYQPDAVYVPGNWVPDFIPGLKVEVFHGLELKKGDDHFRIRGLFDLYCTHGDLTTPKFTELANSFGHFKVVETGWPKLDPLFNPELTDSLPASSINVDIPTDMPTILYTSTFTESLSSAPHLRKTIADLSKQGSWHWLVTLHPKLDKKWVDRYRALEGPHLNFIETDNVLPLLTAADVMLSDTSSIVFEFLMLQKPVVTLNNYRPGPHLINVQRAEEIPQALDLALSRPNDLMKAIESFTQHIHPSRDGHASRRILNAVDELLAQPGTLKPKPLNLFRKLKMRHKMGYYRWH